MSELLVMRVVGRWSLTALMVGGIIGSGIFGVPAKVASLTGRQSPIAWVFAAVGIAVIAACFAEVASSFTVSGGPYIYARAAFGNFAGLQTAWLSWLSRLFSVAAAANLFTSYVLELQPSLNRPFLRALPITVFMALLTAINVRGISMGTRVSNSFTVVKVGLILVFVVAGCAFLFLHGSPVRPVREVHSSSDWLNSILLAVFAYTGFEAALIPAGEARNPDRDTPFATLVALAICTPVYCLVQFVVVQTVANAAASDRPLAAAALVFSGPLLAKEIVLAVLVSVVGFLTGALVVAPRITFAMAEQGDFPRWFAAVHPRFKSPYVSIVSFGVLVWALTLLGTFSWNAKFSAVSRLFTYAIMCAALPILRHKKPGMARFRLPGGVLFATLGVGFCGLLVSRIGRVEILALTIVFAIALVNWIAIRRRARQTDIEIKTDGPVDQSDSGMKTRDLSIVPAETAQHFDQVRTLFLEYWTSRKLSLAVFNLDRELAGLPGEYARPAGRLLLASCDGEVAGCVALRQLEPEICEMKRLYVRDRFRGRGFGRILAETIIAEARSHGYRKMRLDTIAPTMQEAVALYKKLKFQDIPPYRNNPLDGVKYMELEL